jgi:predicted PurR-regulated permease PerM
MSDPRPPRSAGSGSPAIRSVLSWQAHLALAFAAVAVLVLAAWQLAFVLLLCFVGVLLAILVRRPAEALAERARLPVGWSLAAVILLGLGLLAGFLWSAGPRILEQLEELWTRLPAAFEAVRGALQERDWGRALLDGLRREEDEGPRWNLLGTLGGTVSVAIGVLANVFIVLSVGAFLAADPALYRRGALLLVPPRHRGRAAGILDALGDGLWKWMLGQLFDMLVVAVLVTLGLWLLGVPLPLALGLVAGLLNVVPYLGPFLGAAPAVLIAFTQGIDTALWTALLFVAVQQFEGNVVMPLVQKRATALPPALTIAAVTAFGVLFGLIGVFVAAPLLLVLMISTRMVWVEGVLGTDGAPRG